MGPLFPDKARSRRLKIGAIVVGFIRAALLLHKDMIMFAVVKTGGKQYKVAQGDTIQVEKLPVEAGKTVDLNEVLMVCDNGKVTAGTPFVTGAKVSCEVVAQERTGKLIVFKKKRRQNYRRTNNHRQLFTVLKITAIKA